MQARACCSIGGGVAFTLDRKRRKARHARKAAHLQTQAWRAQVNPHFIHTALQNINEYVQANERDLASSFLTRFARLMRAVLENARKDEVSLQSDLDVLHDYLELEKARMHNGFTYSIDIDTDLDPEEAMVPPMLLQPFAEEAIWKGLAKKQGAGHISITVRKRNGSLILAIEDDGMARPPDLHGGSAGPEERTTGTAITAARLELLSRQEGKPASVRSSPLPNGQRVELELPMQTAA
ncbi:MAG: histidine kinase [Flavobacteriales bacterium]|nr:histidine kinase [Flavobacteriales bacterium]